MTDSVPYNPLDKRNLGASVAEALLGRKAHALGQLTSFHGAGIYAIYYSGQHPAYEKLAIHNRNINPVAPIYVGKAIPDGGRKGGQLFDAAQTKALFNRLREHAKSISATGSLDLGDFSCRYLVVDDIWIPLGESLLITKFAPIWNTLIDGFGNHDPGGGRYKGMRPKWDVLHPGRTWADKCEPRVETAAQIEREVKAHLEVLNAPATAHFFVEQSRAKYQLDATDKP
jgi:hypothetical protein